MFFGFMASSSGDIGALDHLDIEDFLLWFSLSSGSFAAAVVLLGLVLADGLGRDGGDLAILLHNSAILTGDDLGVDDALALLL